MTYTTHFLAQNKVTLLHSLSCLQSKHFPSVILFNFICSIYHCLILSCLRICLVFCFLFCFVLLCRAVPTAHGSSQARGQIRPTAARLRTPQPPQHRIQATSVTYTTAHGNIRSLTHWARPGIEPASSWILVGFVSTAPQWELPGVFLVGGGCDGGVFLLLSKYTLERREEEKGGGREEKERIINLRFLNS